MQEQRYSRQREAILENLKNRYDHPTAMELYLSVREDIPNLSLGTLYRNLTLLRDSGKIISLTLGGEEHFDANTNQHYHFKCTSCGRYFDLPSEPLDSSVTAKCLGDFKGKAEGYSLIFYGKCKDCLKHLSVSNNKDNN